MVVAAISSNRRAPVGSVCWLVSEQPCVVLLEVRSPLGTGRQDEKLEVDR